MRQEDAGLGMANTAREGKDRGLLKVGDSWGIRLDQLDETDKKLLRSLLSAGWGSGQGRDLVEETQKVTGSTGVQERSGDTGYGASWGKSRSAEDDTLSELSLQTKDSGDAAAVSSPLSSTLSTPTATRSTLAACKITETSTFRGAKPVKTQLSGGLAGKTRRLEQDNQKQQGSRFDRSMRVLEWLDADCGARLAKHYEQAGGWRHTRDIMSPTPTFSASPPPNKKTEGGKATPPKRSRQGLFIHLPKGGILAASAAQHGHIVQHQLVAGSPRGAAKPPLRLTRSHILSHTTDLWHGYVKDSEEESDSITGGGSTGSASGSVGTPKKRALPEFQNQPKTHPKLSAIPRGFFAGDGDTSSIGSDDSFLADDNNTLFDPSDDDDDDDLVLALRRWEEEQLAQQEALDEISMQEYVTSSEEDDEDNENDSTKSRKETSSQLKKDTTKYEEEDSDSSEDELVKAIRAWQEEQEKFARLQQLQQQRRSSLVYQPPPLTPVLEEEKENVTSASNSPSWEPFGYFYRERNLLVYQVKNSPIGRNVPPHLLHQPFWWEDIGSVREGPSSPPVIAKHRKNPYPFSVDSHGKLTSAGKSVEVSTTATVEPPADCKPKGTKSFTSFLRPSLSSVPPASPSASSKLSLLPPPANAQPLTPSPTSSLKWTPPFLNLSSTSLNAPPNSPNPVASPMLHSPLCTLSSPKRDISNQNSVNKQLSLSVNQDNDGDGTKTALSETDAFQKALQSKLTKSSSTNIFARSPLPSPRLGETPRSKQGGLLTPQPSPDPTTARSTSSEQVLASSPLISRSSGASGFSSLSSWPGPNASGDHTMLTFSPASDTSAGTNLKNNDTTTSTQGGIGKVGSKADIGGGGGNNSGGGRRFFKDKKQNQFLTSSGLAYASFDSGIDRGNSHSKLQGIKSGSSGSNIDKIGEFFRKVGNKLSGSSHDHKNQDKLVEPQHPKLTSTASSPQVKHRHHSADNGGKGKSQFSGSWKLSLSSPSISPTGEGSQIPSPSFLKPPPSPLASKPGKDKLSPLHSPCVATKSDPMGASAYVSRWQAGASWAVDSKSKDKQNQNESTSDSQVFKIEKDTLDIPAISPIFRNLSADNINSAKDENKEKAERLRRKTDAGLGGGNLLLKSVSLSSSSGSKYSPGSNQSTTNVTSFPSSPQSQHAWQRTVIPKQARDTGGGGGGEEKRRAGGRDGVTMSEMGPDSILSAGAHSPMATTRGERKGGGSGVWGEAGKAESTRNWPGVLTDSSSGEKESSTGFIGVRKGKTNNQAGSSPAVSGNYQHQSYHFQNKQQQIQQQQQQQQQLQQSSSNQISKVFLACGEAQPFVVPQSYHHSQHYEQQKQICIGDQLQQQQQQTNSLAPSRLFPRNNLSLASKTSDLLIPTPKDPEPVSPKPISDSGYKLLSGSTSTETSDTNEPTKPKKGFVRRYFTFDTETKSTERETSAYKSKGVLNSAFSKDDGGSTSNYTSSGIGVTARYTCHEEENYLGKLKSGKSPSTTASSTAASAYREALLSSRAGTSERSSSTSSDERSPRILPSVGGGGVERGDNNTLAIPGAGAGRGDKENGAGARRSSHGTCNHLFLQQPAGRKSPLPPQQPEPQQTTKIKKSPSPVRSHLLRAFQNNSSSLSSNSSCGYGGGGGGAGGSVTTPPISPPPHHDDRHHSSSSSLETSPRRQLPELPPAAYRGRRKFSDTGLTPIPRRLLTDGRRGSLTDERTLVSAKSKLGKLRHQGRKSSVAALVKQIHNLWDDDDNDEDNDDEDCNDDESDDERGGGKSKNKKKSSSRRPSGSLLCSFDDQILFERKKKKFPLSLTGNKDKDKDKNSGKDASTTGQGSAGVNGKEEGTNTDKKTTKRNDQGEEGRVGGGEVKRGSGGGSSDGADTGVVGACAGQLTAKIRGGNLTSDNALGSGQLGTSSLSGLPVCAGTLAALSATASASREDPDRFHYLDGSSSVSNRINPNDVNSSSSSCAVGGVSGAPISSSSVSCGGGGVVSELVGPVAQVAGRQLVATAVGGAAACLDCADSNLLSRVGHGNSGSQNRDSSLQQHLNQGPTSINNGTTGQYSKGKHEQVSSSKKTASVQFQPIVSWDDTRISEKTPVFPALRSVLKQGARRHSSFAGFIDSDDNLFSAPSPSPTNPNKGLPPTSAGSKALLSHQDSLGSALTKQAKNAGLPKSKTSDVFRSILKQPERPVVAHAIDSVGGTAGAVASCSSSATTTFSSISPQAAYTSEKKRSKSVSPKAKKSEKGSGEQGLGVDVPAAKGNDAYNKAALSLCLKASRSLSPKHKKSKALESGYRDSVDSTEHSSQGPPLSPYDKDHITDSGHSSLDLSSTKTVGVQVTPRTIGKTSNTGTQTSDALGSVASGGCGGSDSGAEHSSSPTTGAGSSSTSSAGFSGVGEGAGWLHRLASKCMASVGGARSGGSRGGASTTGGAGMCGRVGSGGGGANASTSSTSGGQVGSGGGQHPRTASVRAEWLLGSKRMGSSPSSPVAPANDASERFWVPQGVLARKRAQSLVPTLSKQESEEDLSSEAATPASIPHPRDLVFTFPGVTGDKPAGSGTGCSSDGQVTTPPSGYNAGRRRASMHDAIDLTKIDTRLYDKKLVRQASVTSIEEESQGTVHVSLEHNTETSLLTVNLVRAHNLQPRDVNDSANPYCRLTLLPSQRSSAQSRIHRNTVNPQFEEEFIFEVGAEEVFETTLEISFYEYDQFSKDECVGHVRIPLEGLDLSRQVDLWRAISHYEKPKKQQDRGDIMFSLSYLPSAERLTVVVVKARNLRQQEDVKSDVNPFIKVCITAGNKKLKKKKTSTAHSTHSPTWNEALVFSVNRDSLKNLGLEVSAYHDNKLGIDDLIGKVRLPGNSEDGVRCSELLREKGMPARWYSLS